MQIQCHDCKREFELDLQEKPLDDGNVEVGFECAFCHTWNHGYYTNPNLEQKRTLLQKFEAKARASDADWQRYRRKKAQFQAAYDRLNRSLKARLQPG